MHTLQAVDSVLSKRQRQALGPYRSEHHAACRCRSAFKSMEELENDLVRLTIQKFCAFKSIEELENDMTRLTTQKIVDTKSEDTHLSLSNFGSTGGIAGSNASRSPHRSMERCRLPRASSGRPSTRTCMPLEKAHEGAIGCIHDYT